MPQNRRTFLKGAGIATVAVSAAPLSLSLPESARPTVHEAVAAVPRAFVGGQFALELEGTIVGLLPAVQGGNVVANVVEFTSGSDLVPRKTIGGLKYEEITITAGLELDAALWDWVGHTLARSPVHKNGAVIIADFNNNMLERLEFHNALISEIGLPALDASDKEQAHVTIKFRAESTSLVPASGHLTVPLGKQKLWLASNFRLAVGKLPCSRVSKIEALTIKQEVLEFREGNGAPTQLVPGKLEFPNLVVTFSALDAQAWRAFFNSFVLQGKASDQDEVPGTLDLLAPDLKTVLANLQFSHLGIFRLAYEEIDPASINIQRLRADLYCEGMSLTVGGTDLNP